MAKRAALRGFFQPALASLISKYKDDLKMVSLTKKKKKLMQVLQLFLRLKHFYSELTKVFEPSDSISWFSSVIFQSFDSRQCLKTTDKLFGILCC